METITCYNEHININLGSKRIALFGLVWNRILFLFSYFYVWKSKQDYYSNGNHNPELTSEPGANITEHLMKQEWSITI